MWWGVAAHYILTIFFILFNLYLPRETLGDQFFLFQSVDDTQAVWYKRSLATEQLHIQFGGS